VRAIILKTYKQKINKLESALKAYKDTDSMRNAISRKEIPGFANLEADSGFYEKGDNEITDQVKWIKGLSQPVFQKDNNDGAIVLIEHILPTGQKSFKEATGIVIADYQDLLQKQWVSKLKKEYPIHINQKVLEELEKKFPEK